MFSGEDAAKPRGADFDTAKDLLSMCSLRAQWSTPSGGRATAGVWTDSEITQGSSVPSSKYSHRPEHAKRLSISVRGL